MIGSVGYPDWINRLPNRVEELGSISDPIVQMAYDEIISEGRVSISTGESTKADIKSIVKIGNARRRININSFMSLFIIDFLCRIIY